MIMQQGECMGKYDIRTHELLTDNEEFARLFNMVLHGGEQEIMADSLQEIDSVSVLSASSAGIAGKDSEVRRDLLRRMVIKRDGNAYYMLLGVENQTFVDYGMPLRMLYYDIIRYMLQMHEAASRHRNDGKKTSFTSEFGPDDSLEPIVTVVVYYGPKPWKGPRRLSEMFRKLPEDLSRKISPFLPAYRIRIVSAQNRNCELDRLGRNLRAVLYYARSGWRLKRLKDVLRAHPDLRTVGASAANVISSFMNIGSQLNEKIKSGQKEDVDMTTIADELREEGFTKGRKRGLSEGRKRGLSEGRKRGLSEGKSEERSTIVRNMHSNGMSLKDIAHFTNISTRRLKKIVETESKGSV